MLKAFFALFSHRSRALAAAADAAAAPIAAVDGSGRLVGANEAFRRSAPGLIIGTAFSQTLAPEDLTQRVDAVAVHLSCTCVMTHARDVEGA